MDAHPDRAADILQRHLLVGLSDFDKKGKYSKFHEYAIYTHGYNNPNTILMAYMCVNICPNIIIRVFMVIFQVLDRP